MIVVETTNHKISSSSESLPKLACTGKCKSVWFDLDLSHDIDVSDCFKCGGKLMPALKDKHYRLLEWRKGDFIKDGLVVANLGAVKKGVKVDW